MSGRKMSGKDALVSISAAEAREILDLCRTVHLNHNTKTGAEVAEQLADQFAYIAYAALDNTVPDSDEMARRVMHKNGENAQLKIDEATKCIQHLTEALGTASKALDAAKEELTGFHMLKKTDTHKANDKAESAIAHAHTAVVQILGFTGTGI
ncbi:hypothetical protein DV736_g6309, partial [Chaetothyriales sp. CBS 134916]